MDLPGDPGALVEHVRAVAGLLLAQAALGGLGQGRGVGASRPRQGAAGPGPGDGDDEESGQAQPGLAQPDQGSAGDQGPGGDGDRRGQRGRAPPGDREVMDHEGQHEVGGDQSRARADERLDARGQEHEREDGQRTTAPQRVRQARAQGDGLEHPEAARPAAESGHGEDHLVVRQDDAGHQEIRAAPVPGRAALRPRRRDAHGRPGGGGPHGANLLGARFEDLRAPGAGGAAPRSRGVAGPISVRK